MSNEITVRTYGNWREPKSAGFGKLSFGESLIALVILGIFFTIFTIWGLLPALGFGIASAGLLWAASTKDRHGLSIIDKRSARMKFNRAKRRKHTIYRSGITSPKYTHGKAVLPGILSTSTLSEHRDAYDRPFAIIHHADGSLAVVASLTPAGTAMIDQETIDTQVAYWGMWLGDLSGELGIKAATVTIETVPDSGSRLAQEIDSRRHSGAPQVAVNILEDIKTEYVSGAAQVRAWVTIVFKNNRKKTDQTIKDIASRLPSLTQTLKGTGAGAIHLLPPSELCRLVRVAYDPAAEPLFEEAVTKGSQVDISWGEVGPIGHKTEWDYYRHDSGISRTWIMTAPPRGVVQSGVLRNVLQNSRDVDRKRVTIIYKPIDSALAPDLVESDLTKASARVESTNRPTSRNMAELRAAAQVAAEEAGGAGLEDFGIIITATGTKDNLEDTSNAVASLAASSRLQVRVAYGAQDTSFALGLPLGLLPSAGQIGGKNG